MLEKLKIEILYIFIIYAINNCNIIIEIVNMSNLGEISFAGKIAYNIKSDELKKRILDTMYKKYCIKIIAKHSDKFSEKCMSYINKKPHLICVRSNGNPYFLLLIKINFINYCIFIDKKIQQGYYYPRMIIVNFHFDEVMFKDTVFDGEMVKIPGEKWVFLINDMLVTQGIHYNNLNLIKRINILYDVLQNNFYEDDHDITLIRVKKYFNFSEINDCILNHIPNLKYSCRGIYFKPLFLKFTDILFNFDETLIKKNIQESNSNIKEIIQEENIKKYWTKKTDTPDVYDLFDEKMNYISIACVPTMKISKKLQNLFNNKNMIDKLQIDYIWNTRFLKWEPIVN